MTLAPEAAELVARAKARGIDIAPAAIPALVQGAAWLRGCVDRIGKAAASS